MITLRPLWGGVLGFSPDLDFLCASAPLREGFLIFSAPLREIIFWQGFLKG